MHDVVVDSLQEYGDGDVCDLEAGRWLEGYAEGRRALHAHLRVRTARSGVSGDYCALFNRTPIDFNVRGAHGYREPKGNALRHQERQMGQPMLVNVRKLIENPEGVHGGEAIPSLVRLQVLNDCLRSFGNVLDSVWSGAAVEPIRMSEKDRELYSPYHGVGHGAPLVSFGQFIDEIVEASSEVVEAVPSYERKCGGRLPNVVDFNELLSALKVELGTNTIRVFFDPSSDFSLQAIQVVTRSIQAEPMIGLVDHASEG